MIMRWFVAWSEREYAASARSLACFRIFFAAAMLLTLVPQGYGLDRLPPGVFAPPPGLPRLFGGLPGPAWYWVMNGLWVVLSVALLVGWRTRAVSVALAVVVMLLYARRYSTGKIGHSFLLALTPLVMSLSAWGGAMSVDACRRGSVALATRRREALWSARALALLALGVGLSMASAGVIKAGTGWLSLTDSSTFGHTLKNFIRGRDAVLTPVIFRVTPAWAWELMDWMAVGLELGFAVAWLNRRLFRAFLVSAVFFHIGVALMFDIYFFRNLVTYAAFVDWVALLTLLRLRWLLRVPPPPTAVVAVLVTVSLLTGLTAIRLTNNFDDLNGEAIGLSLLALPGLLLCVGWLTRQLTWGWRCRPRI